MLQRWHHAPRWVVSLVTGAFFGVFYGIVMWLVYGGAPMPIAVGALVGGTIFGVVMGRVSGRLRPQWSAGSSAATPAQHRQGLRAVRGGPVPTDPVSRGVAVETARTRLALAVRWRRLQLAALAAAVVLYVVLALVLSPWWWLGAALFAGFLSLAVWQSPARLSRRLMELTAAS